MPEAGDFVLPCPCGQDGLVVVPEGYMLDGARMQERWSEQFARRRVPEAGGFVPTPGHDSPAVEAERHGSHGALMRQSRPEGFTGRCLPEPGGIVRTSCQNG